MSAVTYAKILMRRGTAAEWAAANPVLGDGEEALETDTGVRKLGDGATAYNDLPGYATYAEMAAARDAAQAAQSAAEGAATNAETARDEAVAATGLSIIAVGGDRTLLPTDVNTMLRFTSATPVTLTIPPNADAAIDVAATLSILQYGAGTVTIAPGAGVTLRSVYGLATPAQYSIGNLVKIAADEWIVVL